MQVRQPQDHLLHIYLSFCFFQLETMLNAFRSASPHYHLHTYKHTHTHTHTNTPFLTHTHSYMHIHSRCVYLLLQAKTNRKEDQGKMRNHKKSSKAKQTKKITHRQSKIKPHIAKAKKKNTLPIKGKWPKKVDRTKEKKSKKDPKEHQKQNDLPGIKTSSVDGESFKSSQMREYLPPCLV